MIVRLIVRMSIDTVAGFNILSGATCWIQSAEAQNQNVTSDS